MAEATFLVADNWSPQPTPVDGNLFARGAYLLISPPGPLVCPVALGWHVGFRQRAIYLIGAGPSGNFGADRSAPTLLRSVRLIAPCTPTYIFAAARGGPRFAIGGSALSRHTTFNLRFHPRDQTGRRNLRGTYLLSGDSPIVLDPQGPRGAGIVMGRCFWT